MIEVEFTIAPGPGDGKVVVIGHEKWLVLLDRGDRGRAYRVAEEIGTGGYGRNSLDSVIATLAQRLPSMAAEGEPAEG